ncbi:MAG: ribosome-binding factor A [Planctomycetaceae bacterium]|nr:ribosome-binding factor A [Planctomycetaceae bacterium]
MSRRTQQLESTLQRAVGKILADGLNDPRLEGVIVSVTEVAVSPDKRHATVHLSVLPESKQELAMHGLQSARAHVQSTISRTLNMRRMPQIAFRLDTSLKKQSQILGAIYESIETDSVRAEDDAAASLTTDHGDPRP